MFQAPVKRTSTLALIFRICELIYHSIVRDIRKGDRHALVGLLMNMVQAMILVMTFVILFNVMGMRGNAIRGDFLLYIMSGIFLFMTHTKAMGAVVGSEGPASPMMQHAPMTTFVSIAASALSSLYTQTLSLVCVLFIYHVAFTPIEIDNPAWAASMYFAAWYSGVGVGMVLLALKPWLPGFVSLATSIYARANMIASGKMFVANTLPGSMLVLFDWNPLFHAIDQTRGGVFLHYNPNFSSMSYPFIVGTALIVIGLMGEFYTRKNASVSWSAAR